MEPYETQTGRYGLREGERYASNRMTAAALRAGTSQRTISERFLLRQAYSEGAAWRERNQPQYDDNVERITLHAPPEAADEEMQVAMPENLASLLGGPAA